ncbi:MAG: YeeE/YedE family protein [Deltaproteobacteria bacterium]|nr:YeeE/YedE family protein [Deltaproteobacteria bacterium]MCD6138328.1 YeeE/YedE family protein [Deltaproteobacteria bacterium]RLB83702.1 MAG: transporter [Deltaproteobacteria bacterium]RLB93594.1 MAG: transporter [Deltaproteobacteria bacterium]RLC08373.1 MAG: transporter [Deltaproteobacteria bacterium]
MDLLAPIATVFLGLIMGYLGQRARMCFIGGMRDYYLVKDTYLIKGLIAFLICAFAGFLLFQFVAPALKTFPWFLDGGTVFSKKWAAKGITASPSPLLPAPGDPITWSPKVWAHVVLAILGGFGLGFFSCLAGGCPFRQHIMAAEGSKSAITYLVGFALGAVIFHRFIAPLIKAIFT